MEHKDKEGRPVYAKWYYYDDNGNLASQIYVIDYDNVKLTEYEEL